MKNGYLHVVSFILLFQWRCFNSFTNGALTNRLKENRQGVSFG
jgi:hypothetical protein